jgi:hypothetical protein
MLDYISSYYVEFFNFWFPWINFFNDVWFFQILILYNILLLGLTRNTYYILMYLFLNVILIGIYLGLVQGELFTGFLWVIEFTLIFIVLLFLFYLNVEGYSFQITLNYSMFLFFLFFLFWLVTQSYFVYYDSNFFLVFFNIFLWEDYYEAFNNKSLNDFLVLTISYYSFNSVELLLIGCILLIGSVVCVLLNRIQKFIKNNNFLKVYFQMSNILNYKNFFFLRKQNFNKQSFYNPSLRVFKKKTWF